MSNKCRSCGAPVIWAAHENTGVLAPINATRDDTGSVVLLEADIFGAPRYRVLALALRASTPGPRYTPHYATCAHAKQWRKDGDR